MNFKNYKYGKLRAILHFQRHEPLDIGFCQRLMFFVFAFFHFLCKFIILNETCQNDKIVNFSLKLDLSLDEHILRLWGSLWVARWLNWIQGHTEGGNPQLSWDPRLQGGLGAPRYVRKNSRKSVRWSAVPVAPMRVYVSVRWLEGQQFSGVQASRLGFGPQGWDLGLQVGFLAFRLGFWSQDWVLGWDLGLKAGIWASRLEFWPLG